MGTFTISHTTSIWPEYNTIRHPLSNPRAPAPPTTWRSGSDLLLDYLVTNRRNQRLVPLEHPQTLEPSPQTEVRRVFFTQTFWLFRLELGLERHLDQKFEPRSERGGHDRGDVSL